MIIGITGKKQSGKDTMSDFLIEKYNFVKYGFADPIKEIAKIIFGFNEEQLYGSKKEVIDNDWGIKPRVFFQKFGTEYGQFIFPQHFPEIFTNINNKTLWVLVFKKWYLNKIKETPHLEVIINDIRFKHEYECIESLGGYIIRIERNIIQEDKHISENEIDNLKVNYTIKNNGTKKELFNKITQILN